jgi:hypothetical protein
LKILLLQLDGKLPSLSLMRIAGYHRDRGDQVELRQARSPASVERGFWDDFDRVYASLIFERSRPIGERLLQVRPDAIIGGTGWDLGVRLDQYGIDTRTESAELLDYTLYPTFRRSMGFTQRGCRLACSFCHVPAAEGKVRSVANIPMLWRGEPWPRELLLLDNDFFGQPGWRDRILEMRAGNFKVSFNQGINARMLSDEAAEAIASVRYYDDDMKRPMLYTAWDNRGDEAPLFRGLHALARAGVKPDAITVYVLIGYWAGETEDDWLYRAEKLREFGARPFPMAYNRNDSVQRGFQRWAIRRSDVGKNKVSWAEYKRANCQPATVKRRREAERMPLFVAEENAP